MATKTARFNSPFIYTTFAPSSTQSIYTVYKERIIALYQQQYPSIKQLCAKDINALISSNKITQFKKQQQQQTSEVKNPEQIEKNGEENKDGQVKKEDKDALVINDDTPVIESKMTVEQQKLINALELLESEYFGNEHTFYAFLCHKYKTEQCREEYIGQPCNTIADKRMEQSHNIICSECDEQKDFTQFDAVELNNGYFAACKECAPDRDSVKTIKWNPEWKAPSISLKEKDCVCYKDRNGHEGAITHLKRPIQNGQHCFRWLLQKHQGWILMGLAPPKKCQNNLYAHRGVWGIANGSGAYKGGRHQGGHNCHHLYTQCDRKLIDMRVDLNKGEIWYMEVDDKQQRIEKLTGIPKTEEGYNPCVSMYYQNHSAQVKKVPLSWFGKNAKRTKFKY